MIKVPSIGRPSPPAHLNPRLHGHILKLTVPQISIQRITNHVPLVKRTEVFGFLSVKGRLTKNAHACRNPHAGSVDIRIAIIVEVQPARAHACTDAIDIGLRGDSRKRSVTVVSVEIVAAKIIHDVQVGQLSRGEVSPDAGETVSIVIDV